MKAVLFQPQKTGASEMYGLVTLGNEGDECPPTASAKEAVVVAHEWATKLGLPGPSPEEATASLQAGEEPVWGASPQYYGGMWVKVSRYEVELP